MANATLASESRKPKRSAKDQPRPKLPEDALDCADEIRTRRVKLGKNQVDFAELVGVRFHTLTEIEGGKRNSYPPSILKRIADGLGCDI